jgi:hypothetical protein
VDGARTLRDVIAPLLENRRRLAPLGFVLLLSFAYFVGAPAWNENSRLALTRALVEDQSTMIDRFAVTTGDKSFRDGHFYSDKAPGTSFLAVPVYAVFHGLRALVGAEPPSVRVHSLDPRLRVADSEPAPEARLPGDVLVYDPSHRVALYLCSLLTVGLASVAAAAATFVVARRWCGSTDVAVRTAVVYALGTPAFVYSTALYGHQLCAGLLMSAFAIVVVADARAARSVPLCAGLLLGLAVMTEYTAAPIALVIAALGLQRGRSFAGWMVAAGLPCAALLAAYHTVAFGNPLSTGYDFVYRQEFAEGMRDAYGLGAPDPVALWQITFGSYRGLFYISPVLLLAAWGLVRLALDSSRPHRAARVVALAIPIYLLLLNAGYYMWDGGASAGPRHVVPALPFLALGLVRAWAAVPRATLVLSIVSVGQSLLLANASPEVAQFGDPLWQFSIDRLLYRVPGPEIRSTNAGLLLGLPGVLSLAPLLVLWWWAWPNLRSGPTESGPPSTDRA